MFHRSYSNFVKANSPTPCLEVEHNYGNVLSGEEAQRLYLEEIKNAKASVSGRTVSACEVQVSRTIANEDVSLSNKDLFIAVQDNDVNTLKSVLDKCPDKVNIVDDFGWSLLMIACQANSVDAAKVLLKRGVDDSVRDKGGNSARSLVIKNRSYQLADLLLSYKQKDKPVSSNQNKTNVKSKEKIKCDLCNHNFHDREKHLSSTIHNISASKGKKIPANYVIPATNKGYQLMLKDGWDRNSGLGKDGSGNLYPIKTVQKKDRNGLGLEKRKKEKTVEDKVKHKIRKKMSRDHRNDKSFEIKFRREFY